MTVNNKSKKYPIGFALSGGGTRGFAHLGAMKALDERGIYPNVLAGTSAGSLAAVFYADGYIPDEIFAMLKEFRMRNFLETALPKEGFFRMTALSAFLDKHLRAKCFEDLKLPLYVVASDIELGRERIFSSGDLIAPIVASCSVPIVFAPVEIEQHYYIDGGVFMNFPVSVIRDLCHTIVGVNVSPLSTIKYDKSLKCIIERTMSYMVGANSKEERLKCDHLIESEELSHYSTFDFKHADEIYAKGYILASRYLDKHIIEAGNSDKKKQKPKSLLRRLLE